MGKGVTAKVAMSLCHVAMENQAYCGHKVRQYEFLPLSIRQCLQPDAAEEGGKELATPFTLFQRAKWGKKCPVQFQKSIAIFICS